MNINQSFRVDISSDTSVSRHGQTVTLIGCGEVLSLSFSKHSVDQLSEIIGHLQKIETEIVNEEIGRLNKYRRQISLPPINSEYRCLEF